MWQDLAIEACAPDRHGLTKHMPHKLHTAEKAVRYLMVGVEVTTIVLNILDSSGGTSLLIKKTLPICPPYSIPGES